MTMYEVRVIWHGDAGTWVPGEVIWRGRSRARAEEIAIQRAPSEYLGTCIVTVRDGRPVSIDWGDHVEHLTTRS